MFDLYYLENPEKKNYPLKILTLYIFNFKIANL